MEESISYGTQISPPTGELLIRPSEGISLDLGLFPDEPGIVVRFKDIETLSGFICRLELLKKGMEAAQNEN